MRFTTILFVGAGLFGVGLLGLVSARRGLAAGDTQASQALWPEECPANREALRRFKYKSDILNSLIDGKLKLIEAAAWCRYVNEMTEASGLPALPDEPGDSDEERFCRQLIRLAGSQLEQDSPGRAKAVVRRLEAELDAYLARGGAVKVAALLQ